VPVVTDLPTSTSHSVLFFCDNIVQVLSDKTVGFDKISKGIQDWYRGHDPLQVLNNILSTLNFDCGAAYIQSRGLGSLQVAANVSITHFDNIWREDAPAQPKPKGYISAFNFYLKAVREDMRKMHPNLKNNDINAIIGKTWAELSKEEKNKYELQAQEDKVRYLKAVQNVNDSHKETAIVPRIKAPKGFNIDGTVIQNSRERQETQGKKRPCSDRFQSSYNSFAKQEKQFYTAYFKRHAREGEPPPSMSHHFSKRWHGMSSEEKQLYVALGQPQITL